jgi:hypothetical protein
LCGRSAALLGDGELLCELKYWFGQHTVLDFVCIKKWAMYNWFVVLVHVLKCYQQQIGLFLVIESTLYIFRVFLDCCLFCFLVWALLLLFFG